MQHNLVAFFVDSVAADSEAANNLKSFKVYQRFSSNKVRHALLKEADQNHVYLKADPEPSQSLEVPHRHIP